VDKKDHVISALMQQRDEAANKVADVVADANVKITQLTEEVQKLKAEIQELKPKRVRPEEDS
jgi:dephospho-CoA kinase